MADQATSSINGIQKKKEFYADVVKNWLTDGPEVIAQRWGVKPISVSFAVGRLRRNGIYIPKNNPNEVFSRQFVDELKELSSQVYGAQEEKAQHSYSSITKKCERCGKEFTKPYNLSRANWEKRQYCSRSCGTPEGNFDGDEPAIRISLCQSPNCIKPGRKFVKGTGITHDGFNFCSERCKEDFIQS
jgi:hypothetical protein